MLFVLRPVELEHVLSKRNSCPGLSRTNLGIAFCSHQLYRSNMSEYNTQVTLLHCLLNKMLSHLSIYVYHLNHLPSQLVFHLKSRSLTCSFCFVRSYFLADASLSKVFTFLNFTASSP